MGVPAAGVGMDRPLTFCEFTPGKEGANLFGQDVRHLQGGEVAAAGPRGPAHDVGVVPPSQRPDGQEVVSEDGSPARAALRGRSPDPA